MRRNRTAAREAWSPNYVKGVSNGSEAGEARRSETEGDGMLHGH